LGGGFESVRDLLLADKPITCCRRASEQQGLVVTDEPSTLCGACPLVATYGRTGALSHQLVYGGRSFGVITLSLPKPLVTDPDEQELVAEVANDIAFGLHALELDQKHQEMDDALRRNMRALNERVKKLDCLFRLSNLLERQEVSLDLILTETLHIITTAWQYPEITCASITLGNQVYQTENFTDTTWKLTRDININQEPVGKLSVCYLEKKPPADIGPFFNEEVGLIKTVAERLGHLIERKQSREKLKESEKRFRTLVENALTGISIVQDDHIVYQNKELERLFGPLPRVYVVGDYANIYPDDLDKVKSSFQNILAGKTRGVEVEFRYAPHGDIGNWVWIYCRAHVIDFRQKEAVLFSFMDMTELKSLEKMLLIQDKMAALGRVTAGIAHEIRNPLSGINIYMNTLEKFISRGKSQERVLSVLHQIQLASKKIEAVIRRVMDFARPSDPKYTFADINQSVEEAVKLSSVTLRKSGVELVKNLDKDLPKCRLDPQQIEEVILNLINNAIDAMKEVEGEKKIRISSQVQNGDVLIFVTDSGPGIPFRQKRKVFDPFFTTKSESTGIGLSICHRIASDHGGTISVKESEWGGAEFRLTIPIGQAPSAMTAE
jgi:PAS domain S-box-containing protein